MPASFVDAAGRTSRGNEANWVYSAIFGQLATMQPALNDYLETRALKVECLHTPFGRRYLFEQSLEYPPGHSRSAFIRAENHAELDAIAFVVPSGVFGKLEKRCDLLGEGNGMFPLCS